MLGFAFTDVKGPLTPCISLLKGQKVTLHDKNALLQQIPVPVQPVTEEF